MIELSRSLMAAVVPRQSWRDEYQCGHDFTEYSELAQPLQLKTERWPKELASLAAERWLKLAGDQPKPVTWNYFAKMKVANEELHRLAKQIDAIKLDIASTDGDLTDYADQRAKWCTLYPHAAEFIVARSGLVPPNGKRMTDEGKLLRMQDARWWRMQLRKVFGQQIENTMRRNGMVCKKKAVYATNWAVRRRQSQKAAMLNALKSARATSSDGDQLSLFELAEHSLSNPALRRGEIMLRMRGFEEIAKEAGHTWTFATLTAPSAFHVVNYNKKQDTCYDNPHYQGFSVRDSQAWQVKQWARVRAKLKRIHVEFYGTRVAEPHHDGTVHWHMMLFVAQHNLEALKKVITEHWLSEYSDELGAKENRVEFEDNDHRPDSSATGYLAKYIAKNIDGFAVGQDYEAGNDAVTSSGRVEAWATTHRIRQFQQVGGPPIGLWREFRRIREPCNDQYLEAVRIHTDATEDKPASFAGFIKAVGGIEVGRKTNVTIYKKPATTPGRYRESVGDVVAGVQSVLSRIATRVKAWIVQWGVSNSGLSSYLGLVSITVRSKNDESIEKRAATARAANEARRPPPKNVEKLVEGTKEWWQWFRASGKTSKDMTRLSLLWNT